MKYPALYTHESNIQGILDVPGLFDGYKTSLALRSDNYLKKNGSSPFVDCKTVVFFFVNASGAVNIRTKGLERVLKRRGTMGREACEAYVLPTRGSIFFISQFPKETLIQRKHQIKKFVLKASEPC